MPDTWKPVVGWENHYSISDVGRLRYEDDRPSNRHSARVGDIVPQQIDGDGYFHVKLSQPGGPRKMARINRLVAEAFIGPQPFDGAQVDHINHRRGDNAVENLEWVSCKENVQRAIKIGLRDFRGEKAGNSKLTDADVVSIRKRAALGDTFKSIAADFGVTGANIANVATGKTWSHISGPLVAKRESAERARLGIPNHAPDVRSNRQRKSG